MERVAALRVDDAVRTIAQAKLVAVVASPAQQQVVARAANEGVVAVHAFQAVVAAGAGNGVVRCISDAFQVAVAREDKVLGIGAQRVADAGRGGVDAAAGFLDDRVSAVVDDVGVVAGSALHQVGIEAAVERVVAFAADQGVVAGATVQRIVAKAAIEGVRAAVAGDRIVASVAGAVDIPRTGKDQVFNVGRQNVVGAGIDGIDAVTRRFHYDVAGVVDDIGVVTRAAGQGVGACAAVEDVGAVGAKNSVVQRVAGAAQVSGAGQDQVLDVGAQRVACRGLHRVGAAACRFNYRVAAVDYVSVVARATDQRVVPVKAGQEVVAAVAGDDVVEGIAGAGEVRVSGQGQVFDIRRQRVVDT